jgi:hypothetical protein
MPFGGPNFPEKLKLPDPADLDHLSIEGPLLWNKCYSVHVTLIQPGKDAVYTGGGGEASHPDDWSATLEKLKGSGDLVEGCAVATGIAIVERLPDQPEIVVWTDAIELIPSS